MKELQGIYFNGITSKQIDVKIELDYKHLIISSLVESDNVYESWSIGEIKNVDFSSAKLLQLQYGQKPQQTLLIEGDSEYSIIKSQYPDLIKQNIYHRLLKLNSLKVIGFSLIVLAAVLFLYFAFIAPYVSQKIVDIVPIKEEVKLGDKMFSSMEGFLDLDDEKSKKLNSFFSVLGFESNYPIELYLSGSKEVNAFAIPGGKIIINKGLLIEMDSWQQLAGLISHELAHVEKRHSLKTLSRNLSTYILIAIITTDVSGITSVFVENAFKMQTLSNSRTFEQEADDLGFEYMLDSNIDPNGILELFEILNESSVKIYNEKTKTIFKMLSTHPLTEDRILSMKNKIRNLDISDFEENIEAKENFNNLKNDTVDI